MTIEKTNKTVVETMAELTKTAGIKLGIDEIEFPDGSKEKFYFNGEADRQAALRFAQVCYNATNDTAKAKRMMATCFALLTKGITPHYETVLSDGMPYFVDYERMLLCDKYGNIVVELEEDERGIIDELAIRRLLEERAERVIWENC